MRTHTFTLTVGQIMDDEHLGAIVDAVNDLAYVSKIQKEERTATRAARVAVDAAGDALTEIHDALRATDGMPTRAQIDAFEEAALKVWRVCAEAIARNEQEQNR